MTGYYDKFKITDDGLEITVNDLLTAKIPIPEEQEFINYSIAGETEDEEWVVVHFLNTNLKSVIISSDSI